MKNLLEKNRFLFLILVIGAILLLARIPFYLTNYIQEDAYISFRCGVNLSETGIYGYNVGEKVSACTSHLHVLIIAIAHYIFGEFFIPILIFISTLALIYGLYILSLIFFSDLKWRLALWAFSALTPISFVISNAGMETSLLILLVALIFKWIYNQEANFWTYTALFLMPFVRPDWSVFMAMIIFLIFIRNKKFDYKIFTSVMSGITAFILFNYLYFGIFLNQSIVAKSVAYAHFSIFGFLMQVKTAFLGGSNPGIFTPLNTRMLSLLSYVFLIIFAYFMIKNFKDVNDKLKNVLIVMVMIIFLIPIIYSIGGNIAPWYLWPGILFVYFITISGFLTVLKNKFQNAKMIKFALCICLAIIILLSLGQWFLALSRGGHSEYMASVGKYIKSVSSPNNTMMLEPAGYIPFFAGLYTYDEVGLVSPSVTAYMRKYKKDWWINYIKDKKPDFIVEGERDYMSTLPDDKKRYFDDNYQLIKKFSYRHEDYYFNPFVVKILKFGTMGDYFVFKKK